MRRTVALLGLCLGGCAGFGYTGSATSLPVAALRQEPGWLGVRDVPWYEQRTDHGCGPAALAMVLRYWEPSVPLQTLALQSNERVSAAELRSRARELGFLAYVVEGTVEDLVHELRAGRPVIVGVAKPTVEGAVAHYEVVVGMHPASQRIATLDPSRGLRANSYGGFLREWLPTGRVLLLVLPTDAQRGLRSELHVERGFDAGQSAQRNGG